MEAEYTNWKHGEPNQEPNQVVLENPTKSVILILVCLFGWMTAVLTINRGGNTYVERCLVALWNAVAHCLKIEWRKKICKIILSLSVFIL